MVRGNNRSIMFHDDSDRWVFMHQLGLAGQKYGCEVHAYVLMSNHVHMLATGREHGAISRMMHCLGRRFVRFANLRHGRTGTLFEGRFKASLVDSDSYFLTCMRYIESNPVRAGMVAHPHAYPWSSFLENSTGMPGKPLVPHETYIALARDDSRRAEAYVRLFEQQLSPAELEMIRSSLRKSRALGSASFCADLEKKLGRPVGITPHGGRRVFKGTD